MISPQNAARPVDNAWITGRGLGVASFVLGVGAIGGCYSLRPSEPLPSESPPLNAPAMESQPLAPAFPEAPPPEESRSEPSPVEPGIQRTLAETRGSLPKAVIAERIAGGFPAFERCLERGLRTNPYLRGQLNLNFVIAPDGSVAFARSLDEGTDFPDSPVVDCVLAALKELRFPEPTGGRVVVTYPLRLEPRQGPQDDVVSQESPGSS